MTPPRWVLLGRGKHYGDSVAFEIDWAVLAWIRTKREAERALRRAQKSGAPNGGRYAEYEIRRAS